MTNEKKPEVILAEQLTRVTNDLKAIATFNEHENNWEAVPDSQELHEADENAEADAIESWNERRSTVETLEIEYRDILRTQEKIKSGKFGICEVCGLPIEEQRLNAKITARTCIAHKDEDYSLSL